jgi:hypothetical protein
MAVLPLNTFKTVTKQLTTTAQTLYICPTGVTVIILLAQVANVDPLNTRKVTFKHVRARTETELLANSPIPIEDAKTMLTGRLVLEEGDRLVGQADADTGLKITLSLVETANT